MKRCPNCNREFSESYKFCQSDGSTLQEIVEPQLMLATDAQGRNIVPQAQTDALTVTALSANISAHAQNMNKRMIVLTLIVCFAIAIALVAGVIFLVRSNRLSESPNNISTQIKQTSSVMTEAEIEQLLQGWRLAWEKRDLRAYSAYYDDNFIGRNSVQGVYHLMTRTEWLEDKEQKFNRARLISIEIGPKTVTYDGSNSVVSFTQTYQAENYSDSGSNILKLQSQKTLYLRRSPGGEIKIVKETSVP
jgi:hypothetical protein